jgi:hypothetical protein
MRRVPIHDAREISRRHIPTPAGRRNASPPWHGSILLERYYRELLNFLSRTVNGPRHAAADLAQESYARVLRGCGSRARRWSNDPRALLYRHGAQPGHRSTGAAACAPCCADARGPIDAPGRRPTHCDGAPSSFAARRGATPRAQHALAAILAAIDGPAAALPRGLRAQQASTGLSHARRSPSAWASRSARSRSSVHPRRAGLLGLPEYARRHRDAATMNR